MEWENLLELMQEGDNLTTKFLSRVGTDDDLGRYMISLSNTIGGKIFIGIDKKNCHLIGTKFTGEDANKIIYTHCHPYFQIGIESIEKNGKQILCITVPEGHSKPYYFKDKCFIMDFGIPRLALLDEETKMQNRQATTPTAEYLTQIDSAEDEKSFQKNLAVITDELTELTNDSDDRKSPIVTLADTPEEPYQFNMLENSYSNPVEAENLTDRQIQALEFLKSQKNEIKNKKYRELFNVSHKTAHLELVDLVSRGYLQQKGSGRSTCYVRIS